MSNLSPTFLDAIRTRRAEIANQRAQLEAEEQELIIAERIAQKLEPTVQPNSQDLFEKPISAVHVNQTDLILATLRSSKETWFESTPILKDEIQRIHGVEIKESSFYPLLSKLKTKGVIARDGAKVALSERVGTKSNNSQEGSDTGNYAGH